MIRITADIDSKNSSILSLYLHKAIKKIKQIEYIEVKKSNSKGYHLTIWSSYPYKENSIFYLRKYIGDDYTRIRLDKDRKYGRQIFFDKKIYRKKKRK